MTKNRLYCGDNLEILATMEKESVDLIYIDPPFFSNRHYEIIWGDEAEIRSFEDRWEGGINVYVDWMKTRVMELHRVLKPTGSMYLHCDWHAGHYLKVMMDEVFGANNFRNEIVWCYRGAGYPKKDFGKRHDTIFRYSKTSDYTFNLDDVREKYAEATKERFKHYIGNIRKGKDFGLQKLHPLGRQPDDWWQIQPIAPSAKERLGYPTQKPEKLLERIIRASSNEGDLVLDAFCGCGTALAVAQNLGRRWIGIDISPSAIALIKNRLKKIGVSETDIDIIGMPETAEDLKRFKPYEFQYWAINEMHATPSPRKSADMGIDGFSFIEHHPIQVKQSESIGRNVVDNFETALRRYYKHKIKDMKGYIVAFSFGKGAREEVARVKKEGIDITLITVQDILDKKFSVLPSSESSSPVKKERKRKSGSTVIQPHLFRKREGSEI
jgi:DNA modification methylase